MKRRTKKKARRRVPVRQATDDAPRSAQVAHHSAWPDSLEPEPAEPALRFTPYAWAKLHFFCHHGETEIGGFGLSDEDDPLLVIDLLTLKQRTTAVSVAFDDEAVADLFESMTERGIPPHRFARLWLHSHPGHSAEPSSTDEETFDRVFGPCDWAVMAILARGGATYARLRFNVGPGGRMVIPMRVDYAQPFAAADHAAWEAEYRAHIQAQPEWWDLDLEALDVDDPAWLTALHASSVDDSDSANSEKESP